jgi:anti-sigma regulatory factor (Ser/Thr protein kinase)
MGVLRLPAKLESLESFRALVLGEIEGKHGLDALAPDLDLVMEEILTNIIFYAYPEGEGDIEIECNVLNSREIKVAIRDWGSPFNPLDREAPDLSPDISEREVGGLGIFFVRQLTREAHYERKDGANVLTLHFAAQKN